jgi:aspartyl-tRNA(Asn)/glutamyl-tRNA(Gln) amidotransferase subunit A
MDAGGTLRDGADGVVATAAAVRSGERSARDVVEAHLAAAHDAQEILNAFTVIDDDAARRAAEIDRRIAARGPVGRLAGVPIAIKDLIDQAGVPTTNGAGIEPSIPPVSATCISRLEAADAVLIGRTGLHEWAFGFSSENHFFGPVRNPWDRTLSPGGSSGGSAAAVAAGLSAAALGTDTGGSVRVPAALCGVAGLKVTHGRVPLAGVTPLAESVDTVGPIARSVADLAAVYSVIAGDDPADPWSRPRRVIAPGAGANLAHLRVGVPHPWIDLATADAVRAAFETGLAGLAAAGATVVHLDLPDLTFPGAVNEAMYPEVASVHRERYQADPDGYGPEVRRRLQQVFEFGLDDYLTGLRWRSRIRAVAGRALNEVDVLVTPTVGLARKVIGDDQVTIGDRRVSYRPPMAQFTALVNHLGLPALTLPLPDPGIPPAGIQLIGAAWSEHHLLEIGTALETAGIVMVSRPPLWRPRPERGRRPGSQKTTRT